MVVEGGPTTEKEFQRALDEILQQAAENDVDLRDRTFVVSSGDEEIHDLQIAIEQAE